MANEDYYKTLDVPRSATQAEIQKAYRRLAKKYHPDLHENKEAAKQNFQKIQQAYDVLGDEKKREMYDRFGPDFEQMRGLGGQPFEGQYPPGGMDIDFSQIFGGRGGQSGGMGLDEILRQFGGGGARGRGPGGMPPQPPPEQSLDVEMDITVPFAVAILGGEHRVTLERKGTPENIAVKIPKGIESGKKIRLRNQGQVGRDRRQGDLLIRVNVAPHPFYRRHGLHLQVNLPVTVTEALFGTKVDLPTPYGTVSVTVPANSSSGRVLRLKGMGVRTEKDERGDLLAELEIVVPDNIPTDMATKLKLLLENIEREDPRGELSW
jgi:curved DNA-binding protein